MANLYPALQDIKDSLGTAVAAEDTILGTMRLAAIGFFERYTGRQMVVSSPSVRYFPVTDPFVTGNKLTFYLDLAAITTVTNGDGTALAATDYILYPQSGGRYPYSYLTLTNTNKAWTAGSANDGKGIAINGSWGYSTTCPDDVWTGILDLAKYFYRIRQTGIPTSAAFISERGLPQQASEIPGYILQLFNNYKRS